MYKAKIYLFMLSLSMAIFFYSSCSQPKALTILHTNDIHSNFLPHEAAWVRDNPKPQIGGFNELYFVADSIKRVKNVLLLDAGDVMTGNPITEYKYKGALGGALFEMMNMIGYEVWCPGNHDFDISQDNFVKLTKIAKFPTVSANLVNNEGKNHLNNLPYIIVDKTGIKIGIIGIMSQDLYGLVNQNNLVGIRVLSPIETLQKYINEIDTKTDLIIALTHQGVYDDSVLAVNVRGLDVIIGAHSHTRLTKPKLINDVIIAQAGGNNENLGELELFIENDKVTSFNGKLIPLWFRADRPKNQLSSLVDSMQITIEKDYSEIIGILKSDWKRGGGESGIGNFITDAQRIAAKTDIAFMNNHGIRRDLPAGKMSKKDLFEVLPFYNILTTFQLSGQQIKSIVKYYIKDKSPIQFSGIKCQWTKKEGDIEILKLDIQGKPIEDDRIYSAAASDYFIGEAKRYLGLEINNAIQLNMTVFDEVRKVVLNTKEIDSKIENRIEEIK
ncbi:MAG: bifunctional UDP-sugar hydrolase/5'-nucleotidase [Bacteroidota bacterium]|nr:bifunctional UDP-sugar hydrolase/5'-nucleotidase [Bacteroidota bacterium]